LKTPRPAEYKQAALHPAEECGHRFFPDRLAGDKYRIPVIHP
jgi:hypothetical protein